MSGTAKPAAMPEENPHRPWNTTNKGEGTLADTKNRNRVIASSGKAIDEPGGDAREVALGKLVSVPSIGVSRDPARS